MSATLSKVTQSFQVEVNLYNVHCWHFKLYKHACIFNIFCKACLQFPNKENQTVLESVIIENHINTLSLHYERSVAS
jgi:hypothetical protein